MASIRTISSGVAMLAFWAVLCPSAAPADPRVPGPVEIPIYQTAMRNGSLRYSVWVKVGDRSIEALLDTGSTGLRVLPAVVPGDLTGLPLEASFATGETMRGLAIGKQVEIGAGSAMMTVEVIDGMACRLDHPTCSYAQRNTDYLIGGDGETGHGFSAILGIGFTAPDRDLQNPLELLGAKQWIVDLPRPDDDKPGRIILNPDPPMQAQFKMHQKFESGDVYGCLRAKDLNKDICGAVAFDSGGPTVLAVTDGDDSLASWPGGTGVSLKVQGEPPLQFKVGDQGPATTVWVLPYKMRFKKDAPYINAGVYPYLFYDVLYDAAAHQVGLKARDAATPPKESAMPVVADEPALAKPLPSGRRRTPIAGIGIRMPHAPRPSPSA